MEISYLRMVIFLYKLKRLIDKLLNSKNLSSISFNSYNSELNNKYKEKRKNEYRFLL